MAFSNSTKPFMNRRVRRVVASLDFPSVAAAASATLTVAVPKARVGDLALVCSGVAGGPTAGLVHSAWVSASDVVTVRATNVTAAPIDQAAHSYVVTVLTAKEK